MSEVLGYIYFIMWKWLIGIAAALIVASLIVTCHYESSCEQKHHQDHENLRGISEPVSVNHDTAREYAEECKVDAPWWYRILAWPEGATALALILTLIAITAQAILMREHAGHFEGLAKATSRQADIEEANMSQWVEAEFYGITAHGMTTIPNSNAIRTADIVLRGRVINPTPLPLTLYKVVAEICREEPVWERFEYVVSELLSPSKKEENYPFSVRLELNVEQTANLMANRLDFAIAIHVDFIEAAGKSRSQTFRSFLRCGTHTVNSSPFVGNELIAKEQSQNQNPN
jgi:hypothetical protein